MPGRTRLQLDITNPALAHLDALVELTDAGSRAEVIRHALALYDHALNARKKGQSLMVENADGTLAYRLEIL